MYLPTRAYLPTPLFGFVALVLCACMCANALPMSEHPALPVPPERAACPYPAKPSGSHCMCSDGATCIGSKCVKGKSKTSDEVVEGFKASCVDCSCVLSNGTKTQPQASGGSRVLIVTVATHREPFIELLEQSVRALGHELIVAGMGEFFKGYGWKLKKVRDLIEKRKDDFDIVLFSDSFDSFVFCELDEIIAKFRKLGHPMVVSAEENCWPNPHLAKYIPTTDEGRYPFPNSGGYIAELPYLLDLYTERIAINHKSDCTDDQGELIKAIARDSNSFLIDHNAVIFQTLFGKAKNDLKVEAGRVVNFATNTKPCVVHANGWDKAPLLRLLKEAGKLTEEQQVQLLAEKASLEKKKTLQVRENDVNQRCAGHNPNPSLEPERNLIKEYGLSQAQQLLKKQVDANPYTTWYEKEQQLFEVQEYRVHCPVLPEESLKTSVLPKRCDDFKVYVYPLSPENEIRLPKIDRAVRRIIAESPYATENPDEACLFVPSVPVSCWCEFCMEGTYSADVTRTPAKSQQILDMLKSLPHWNQGRNHILFEFSDAPCISYQSEYAIVATVGISKFHLREGLDVSMPLFSMVPYSDEERREQDQLDPVTLAVLNKPDVVPDAIRNQLPKLHNGNDILLLIACRWFGEPKAGERGTKGYDENCAEQEKIFQEHTYSELAMGSKFSLIVEGFGYHSFRLTEAMAAGSIPVIVVDHYVLPYEDILDWDSFSVRVPEWKLLELPEILRAIPPEKVEKMQQRVVFVFENFLRSLAFQVHTAIESARINLFENDRAAEVAKLRSEGLPLLKQYPTTHWETPEGVILDSKRCNAPSHRQADAKDGRSVMLL